MFIDIAVIKKRAQKLNLDIDSNILNTVIFAATFETQLIQKLSNTEAELKKVVAYKRSVYTIWLQYLGNLGPVLVTWDFKWTQLFKEENLKFYCCLTISKNPKQLHTSSHKKPLSAPYVPSFISVKKLKLLHWKQLKEIPKQINQTSHTYTYYNTVIMTQIY